MQDTYNLLSEIPFWVALILVVVGFGYALTSRSHPMQLRGLQKFQAEKPKISLGSLGVVVGIIAGIIGSIVGVIQIGIFFGWWPEKLALQDITYVAMSFLD